MENSAGEVGRASEVTRKPVPQANVISVTPSSPPNPPRPSLLQHGVDFPAASQHAQPPPTVCSNICNRCKSGIPYEISYYECGWCHVLLCGGCTSLHPPSHQSTMIRRISRHTHTKSFRDPRPCIHCKKSTHVRYDCRLCQISVCAECYVSAEGPRHEHADYVVIEIPGKSILRSPLLTECRECVFRAGIAHCDGCLIAIPSNDIFMFCGTCEVTFDGSISLCRKCHVEKGHLHDPNHQWASLATQLCTDAAQKPGVFGCTQCPRRSNELRDLVSKHSHSSLVAFLGPRTLDYVLPNVWRTCQRKPIRDDAPMVSNLTIPHGICDWCGNKFLAFSYQCKSCPDFVLCDICYPTAPYLHQHGPSSFASCQQIQASRAPPPKKQFKLGKIGIKAIDKQVEKLDKNGKVSQGLQSTGQFGGRMVLAFVKGAIGAEINIANGANANYSAGGNSGGGNGYDTSSGSVFVVPTSDPGFTNGLQQDTWASTSSGASDPIQGSSGSNS